MVGGKLPKPRSVPQIVIDTNVLIAALRSQLGASHRLLLLVDSGKFELNLSVPLLLEYEAVCKRHCGAGIALAPADVDDVLDYLCRVANLRVISYLWRPLLRDPGDDMVLELAFAGGCERIVTYNRNDLAGAEVLGVRAVTPASFLREIGELAWARSTFTCRTRCTRARSGLRRRRMSRWTNSSPWPSQRRWRR